MIRAIAAAPIAYYAITATPADDYFFADAPFFLMMRRHGAAAVTLPPCFAADARFATLDAFDAYDNAPCHAVSCARSVDVA